MKKATVQNAVAVKAASMIEREAMYFPIGTRDRKKLMSFRAPNGRHFALVLTNQRLTAFAEPVDASGHPAGAELLRRYPRDKSRHSNLNFGGSALAVGSEIDCWAFDSIDELMDFGRWYGRLHP